MLTHCARDTSLLLDIPNYQPQTNLLFITSQIGYFFLLINGSFTSSMAPDHTCPKYESMSIIKEMVLQLCEIN